jgi:hypothetical protein
VHIIIVIGEAYRFIYQSLLYAVRFLLLPS